MDSADPKSNRGWRTRLTFQERATRADRGSVAVRETRETGGRSTGGLAAEARAAVEHAIAKGFFPKRRRKRRRRVVIAFRPPASGSKKPQKCGRLLTVPDRPNVVAFFTVPLSFDGRTSSARSLPDCVSRRADARVRRLTPCRPTRTRFWRSSSSTSRSGYVFTVHEASGEPRRPRKMPNAFSRRRRPRAAIRAPIGVARALTDVLPPTTPPVFDHNSSRCTARRSRSARRRSRR